jgi:hypothetical protein
MILFECPGMIGPLDTATLARRPIIPFWGRERYDSRISEQKILPMDRALSPTPPPGEHLGLFCGNQKTHFFASFTTNGNTARVKIPP